MNFKKYIHILAMGKHILAQLFSNTFFLHLSLRIYYIIYCTAGAGFCNHVVDRKIS